ncbi:MAG: hypothetical protein M1166_04995 [Candidatus Thermoplasmatota archaeon]|jgi:hypothetical protein|nr:hypothetical protein [Candidatus Thermoplasmatota archaeon]
MKFKDVLNGLLKNKARFHSFVWGFAAALLLVLPGSFIISYYRLAYFSVPIAEYVGVIIFIGSVGVYFGQFWKNDDESVASVFGFLLVLMITFIIFSYQQALVDGILVVSFLFGFEFVVSGRYDKTDKMNMSLRKFLSKTSWYLFSLELMVSFELPLFDKIISYKIVSPTELGFVLGLAVLYILFVLYVHYYIDRQSVREGSEVNTELYND